MRRCKRGFALLQPNGENASSVRGAAGTFRLSFELTPHGTVEDPATILRLEACMSCNADGTESMDTAAALASRMPVFCFVPGTTRLLCALGPHGRLSSKFYSPEPGLPVGKSSRITARLGPSSFTVSINGEEGIAQPPPPPLPPQLSQAECGAKPPVQLPDLRIWAGDDHYCAADASVGALSYRPVGCEGFDEALLQKMAVRLRCEVAYKGLLISELVELAEALDELEVRDGDALKVLGQQLLSRRKELAPDEVRRVHIAFKECKAPLSAIWGSVGAKRKRENNQIRTVQVFAPQDGHEDEDTRATREVNRVSPPRYCWDPIRASY